ncbi:MAG: methyltransferase domain-containing protein [Flavobacteriia bacterium]|nr:methyltransferase domain-containing protein [Flavobacteriia bacterium]
MDPIGKAILDFAKFKKPQDIYVDSPFCDTDIIPVEVLFRTYEEMPEIEKKALQLCKGNILDVGAGAGVHSSFLKNKGFFVDSIDTSEGAVDYMKSVGLNAKKIDFFDLQNEKYDTILMLMNGLGISGTLSHLEFTLNHAKNLLNENGQIICDSSDVHYLYEEEDGSYWENLNNNYYGDFQFTMTYKKEKSSPFSWLYVDFSNLFKTAKKLNLNCNLIIENDNHYLAVIEKK